jgi:hypothetical protein
MYAYLRDIKREGEIERDYTGISWVGRGVKMSRWLERVRGLETCIPFLV